MIDRAERISQAIKAKGISYAELERITGVSKSALQRYASGETKKIPVDVIESIAAATGVTAIYLMGWDSPEDKESPSPVEDEREAYRNMLSELTEDELKEMKNFTSYLRWKREHPGDASET